MHYTLNFERGRCFVAITGEIDTSISAVFDDIERAGHCTDIVIDCNFVTRINSVGIKTWIEGMRQLDGRATFTFRRCTSVFVEVAAMVPAFVGDGVIASLYLGYVCDNCETESALLVQTDQDSLTLPHDPACEKCGAPIQPDEFAKEQADLLLKAS